MLKILRVKKLPIYDVFYNDGWLDWTRVLVKDNQLRVIAGNSLPQSRLVPLTALINTQRNPNAQQLLAA